MEAIRFDGFIFVVPIGGNKKYEVYDQYFNKITSFGDRRYEQYYDKIGYYSDKDHNDAKRRSKYYQRFGYDAEPYSAKWFSHRYLW